MDRSWIIRCIFISIILVIYLLIHCNERREHAQIAAARARGPPCRVDLANQPENGTCPARHSGSDGAQCSVCLGTVQAGEMVRQLPLCKHLYHIECIDTWLASHDTCPLCRSVVEPPENGGQPATKTELSV